MISNKILASIVAAIIAISTIVTAYELNPYDTTTTAFTTLGIKYHGHVTYTVKDQFGNVKDIYESDNTRTVAGINCAEQIMFNGLTPGPLNTNGTNVCGLFKLDSSAKFNGFRFIGLMNQTSGKTITMNGSDTVATSKIGGTRVSGNHGIIFTANQGLPVNSTVAGTGTYNVITITSSAIPVTGVGSSGTNICGAALLNSTSSTANVMFAENSFSCISLQNTDSITITWTITLT